MAEFGVVPGGAGDDAELPAGTVTFLLTDIEGSTRLWEIAPEAMEEALERHNRLLTEVIERHGGVVVTSRGEGDSFFAVFPSATSAVEAAGACQLRLAAEAWPAGAAVRVRMGLHTGEARLRGSGRVDHAPINRCARVKAAGHGGQVLLTRATCTLVDGRLGGEFGLARLGEFRLRDLAGPELIYQLTHAELPARFPPLKTRHAGNLPLPVSSFIGRARELERIAAMLGDARVMTLTGVGGVGKTRLAVQAAGEAQPRFGDGAWLCELAPVRDPAGVTEAVAAVFSVAARAGQSTREALVEFLRGRELLLVLDNCEHVLAEAAALAGILARSCERLVILATSREGLGIEGEQLMPVPPLAVPGAGAGLDAITDAEAVRLFAERAAAVKPEFAVTGENAAAVTAVVRRLDGLALAIELAAARVPTMTPAELARRLERSFAVLGAGLRGAAERHRTLRAAIDWSFDLLAAAEQALLARLAVFAGGATLEAAEVVCGADGIDPEEVLGLMGELVARSLVVTGEHGSQTRYRLLEPIRQYGEERLEESGKAEWWRARHAGYYADLLRRVREHGHHASDEMFWTSRLSADQDNLLAAWSWAISAGDVGTAFTALAGFAPSEVWNSYPFLLPGEAALELPGAAGHPGYPLALAVSAVFASGRGDVAGAEQLCHRATEANAGRDVPDWRVEATVLATRENLAVIRGQFTDAARFAEQAAGLARAGGDRADASIEFCLAAVRHMLAGDASAAVPLAREGLALARQVGAPALVATSLLGMGISVAGTDPGQARAYLNESREISATVGHHSALNLIIATGIAFVIRDRAAALELGGQTLRNLQPGGDRRRMSLIMHMIAGTLADTRPEAAAIILGASESYSKAPLPPRQLVTASATTAFGEEHTRELHARGASLDWDQAIAYTLTQAAAALEEIQPGTPARARG